MFGPVVREPFLLQTDIFDNHHFLAIHKHTKKFEVLWFETLSLTPTTELIKKALLTFSHVENTKQLIKEKNQPWNI